MTSPEPAASEVDDLPSLLFGSYVLFEKLGQGGFGIVYRARRVGDDETVALKQMRGGAQASAEERKQFLSGAEVAASLDHPGIVRVRDVGERDGCPFFTMDWVEGIDLATALELGRPSHAQAARWLGRIAAAVDHAHARCVLHSDLKPANILLDKQGQAFVTDFGSARRLSQQGQCVESGAGGLSYYMSPEQAAGDARALTQRSDIYALGVILYELLTGQVPDEHAVFATWLTRLVSDEPVPAPSKLEPDLNRGLERICLKCLEKDPSRRYASAALLADDLELVVNGWRPRHARSDRAASRSLRWVRRHPAWSAALAALALVLTVVAVTARSLEQAERQQQASALETNGFIASSQAGALLFQLRELADRVERCVKRPGVVARLAAGSVAESAPELEPCSRGFQAVWLIASDGRLLTQFPTPVRAILGRNYAFRGYFRGAAQLAARSGAGVHLSGAFRSESTSELQVALSAPAFDASGKWIGVVGAAAGVDSAIDQIGLRDSGQAGRIVALLGPREHDRHDVEAPLRAELDFVVHPRLGHGREVALLQPNRSRFEQAFGAVASEQFALRWAPPLLLSDYRDPLLEPAQGSLAAFAPVGGTGYVVVVQTANETALQDVRALTRKLAWRAGLPLALGLSLLGLGVLATIRRKRSLELRPAARQASSAS